jgi:polyphosphate kinase
VSFEVREEGLDHAPNLDTMLTGSETEGELRPVPPAIGDDELLDPSLYISRETSWLEFNDRVLEEALDAGNPLLERLKFIAIYGTNLDEFFMIRVAGLKQQIDAEVNRRSDDGLLPREQLAAVAARLQPSLDRMTACLEGDLFPALVRHGIRILPYRELDATAQAAMKAYFRERVFPVLTPLAIDAGHPFPYISNLSLSLAVELRETTPEGPVHYVARVKIPPSLPRFVPIDSAPSGQHWFVPVEDLIAHNLHALFPGMEVVDSHAFRVTRDADLDLQEDEADDLLRAIESELRKRRFGEPVRLEVARSMPDGLRALLRDALALTTFDCYEIEGMMATSALWSLVGINQPALHDPPFTPSIPKRLRGATDLFAVIREGDLLLQHPYQSFDPVVQFVRQAASDPDVLAIKQTLYRTSGDSPVVSALIDATEAGKQVATLIELKARFDEENNILWARNLERVGAHVVYGLSGLKTHAKVTLIVRNEPDGIRRYMHFGTGNYNDKTAKLYTDLSLFTCRPDLGRDASQLFNALTGFSKAEDYERLLVAPTGLRTGFMALIERETAHAKAGRPSGITAKLNAINDAGISEALYGASRAGVPIDLVIRGMCILRPGVPGVSETIRVTSIVGRFLEHSRIFVFANGGQREVFIGSADWMGRNLDRRVETVVPVLDPALAQMLCDEIVDVYVRDNVRARTLLSDGSYVRRAPAPGEPRIDTQQIFLERYEAIGRRPGA